MKQSSACVTHWAVQCASVISIIHIMLSVINQCGCITQHEVTVNITYLGSQSNYNNIQNDHKHAQNYYKEIQNNN